MKLNIKKALKFILPVIGLTSAVAIAAPMAVSCSSGSNGGPANQTPSVSIQEKRKYRTTDPSNFTRFMSYKDDIGSVKLPGTVNQEATFNELYTLILQNRNKIITKISTWSNNEIPERYFTPESLEKYYNLTADEYGFVQGNWDYPFSQYDERPMEGDKNPSFSYSDAELIDNGRAIKIIGLTFNYWSYGNYIENYQPNEPMYIISSYKQYGIVNPSFLAHKYINKEKGIFKSSGVERPKVLKKYGNYALINDELYKKVIGDWELGNMPG